MFKDLLLNILEALEDGNKIKARILFAFFLRMLRDKVEIFWVEMFNIIFSWRTAFSLVATAILWRSLQWLP